MAFLVLIVSGFLFPFALHWVALGDGWLTKMGFFDSAGGVYVHWYARRRRRRRRRRRAGAPTSRLAKRPELRTSGRTRARIRRWRHAQSAGRPRRLTHAPDSAPERRAAVHGDDVAHVVDVKDLLDEVARAGHDERRDDARHDADPRLDDGAADRRRNDAAERCRARARSSSRRSRPAPP